MSVLFLMEQLNLMENPKRENRQRVANIVLEDHSLFKDLVAITFNVENEPLWPERPIVSGS